MSNIQLNISGVDMQELAAEVIIDAVTGKVGEDDLARQISAWSTIIDLRPA